MKKTLLVLTGLLLSCLFIIAQTGKASRMHEIFKRTDLVPAASGLNDPWEITYGPDDSLWITEAKGYLVKKFHPSNPGAGRVILNLTNYPTTSYRKAWGGTDKVPQGGLMGLAIHPDFMRATNAKKFVYVVYVHDYYGRNVNNPNTGQYVSGHVYETWLVRFTYNTTTGMLGNPQKLCDTLPGSNDHNSGRLIIKPENGVNYLYYALGDMGAGQFDNVNRTIKSQMTNSYEGKILRFNLESDGDTGGNAWIPDDNPFNGAAESAVWATGIRNNQGFAYAVINGVGRLYGASHGPFSDDEINLLEKGKNYGHPRVIGYKDDGNYDSAKAGPAASSLPLIYNEKKYAEDTIGTAIYGDPLFSHYPPVKGDSMNLWTIQHIYVNKALPVGHPDAGQRPQNKNGYWGSEGIAGMDIYTHSTIPGWKNSLFTGTLKGGKIIRQQLNSTGTAILSGANYDTIGFFRSTNRFRDLAFSPDGKSMYVVIDKSATTSGPTTDNPIISSCAGCVQKYTFLGYESVEDKSPLPEHITIAPGTANACEPATTISINSDNTNYWVPITDANSNIIAEIKGNGEILGDVNTSFYVNNASVREDVLSKSLYLNRNVTITPQFQPQNNVNVRIYLTESEFLALKNGLNSQGQPTGISGVTNLGLFKNSDPCGNQIVSSMTPVINNYQLERSGNGYVLQATISSFSTFYIANSTATLPLHLLSFTGSVESGIAKLKWITESESLTSGFEVQRSINGLDFISVANVNAKGGSFRAVYQATDPGLPSVTAPSVFYRLKVNNTNGGFSYSNVISFNLAKNKGTLRAKPNPVTTNATIEINAVAAELVYMELADNSGKTVLRKQSQVRIGSNNITLLMSTLPAGTYYLKVNGNHINQVIKLQKL